MHITGCEICWAFTPFNLHNHQGCKKRHAIVVNVYDNVIQCLTFLLQTAAPVLLFQTSPLFRQCFMQRLERIKLIANLCNRGTQFYTLMPLWPCVRVMTKVSKIFYSRRNINHTLLGKLLYSSTVGRFKHIIKVHFTRTENLSLPESK